MITVTITIHADVNNPMTELESKVLQALGAERTNAPVQEETKAEPKGASKPALKSVPSSKPEEEVVPEQPSGDFKALYAQAVEKATAMMSSGQTAKIKEALAPTGAKRVSDLKTLEAVTAFLEALDA